MTSSSRSGWQPYGEYISPERFLGLPVVHVVKTIFNEDGGVRFALGWVAIGPLAAGPVAVGYLAIGVVSLGLIGVGAISIGIFVIGIGIAAANVALSFGLAFGNVAVGGKAFGQVTAELVPQRVMHH